MEQASRERKVVPPGAPPTLELENVSKTFRATRALDNVALTVRPGEVHGLLGTNGSGKSTLIKILAGFHAPDPGGVMRFNGQPVSLPLTASDFRRLGMSFVHQNLGLVPSLTVLENLRLSQIALGDNRHINWRKERAAAQQTLDRYGVDVEQWRRIDEISAVNRALIAIIRAFEEIREECERTGQPGLVLLDEPTPFLPKEGVDRLFRLMRQIADHGSSVTFISHDIDEVMEITDRVTILRDGKVSGEIETREASRDRMIEMIIGRSLGQSASVAHEARRFEPFAEVEDLVGEGIPRCNISVGRGEIIGLTGLIGSGYERVPYLLFGASQAKSGMLKLSGGDAFDLSGMTPARAIQENFALLPGDRPTQSGVGGMKIFENMLLPDLDSYFRGGFLRNGRMRREARRLGEEFEVRPNDPDLNLAALSGGNAQKVLIARWLKRKPRLLLLDEPTQGVDVGTRANIFEAVRRAAAEGMSVVCASSDAEQLAELCDRVLVFARGRIVDELTGAGVEKDRITQACYSSLDAVTANAPGEERKDRTG
ncbi:sugar ABC transporter ATP-binding protein [Oricola thermophila]|uniref:Sugar ABC transporter ATP-binding protein n=1 Tax=Oricola thermophila TaxID=2742145 RepID=A0A6N1VIC5_9HYPH|nr:sugar ABC transporter ATP-binding protein [Oricola thermophila]